VSPACALLHAWIILYIYICRYGRVAPRRCSSISKGWGAVMMKHPPWVMTQLALLTSSLKITQVGIVVLRTTVRVIANYIAIASYLFTVHLLFL